MDLFEIIIISFGLAMDAAAVSFAAAASGFAQDTRSSFRLAFHFGLFQFLMPVIGWFFGVRFVTYFATIDHWIAFALLLFVGGRMLYSGIHPDTEIFTDDPSRGLSLVILSLATSVDALAIGLTLSMLKVNIWYPSAIIGIITGLIAFFSILIGKRLGALIGERMKILGGSILIFIGVRILMVHLF